MAEVCCYLNVRFGRQNVINHIRDFVSVQQLAAQKRQINLLNNCTVSRKLVYSLLNFIKCILSPEKVTPLSMFNINVKSERIRTNLIYLTPIKSLK